MYFISVHELRVCAGWNQDISCVKIPLFREIRFVSGLAVRFNRYEIKTFALTKGEPANLGGVA